MYWVLGVLGMFALWILRRRFSLRHRICGHVRAAQQALDRKDFPVFDRNLKRAKQMAEGLGDEALRKEFRGDLALIGIQGAYWRGDLAGAESACHAAINTLASIDPEDPRGRLVSAHVCLGDLLLDTDQPDPAAAEFRAAAELAERSPVPVSAVFALQRLADALLDAGKRDLAEAAVQRCFEIEKSFFAGKQGGEGPAISMTAPDLSLVRGDFATAERLFAEKVHYFESSPSHCAGLDVLRYRLHLAEAQVGMGEYGKARATLTAACTAEEARFGPEHPRIRRIRRRIDAIPR